MLDITDKIITIIFASIILAVIAVLIFLSILFPPLLSQKTVEKDFAKNYDDIIFITNFLIDSEYTDVWINSTDDIDTIYVNNWRDIVIDDSKFISIIKSLFKKRYKSVHKNKNYIKFCRSSTIHEGNGVVYSIDGSEPIFPYLIKLEQLPETNWYYYEEKGNR